MRSIIILWGTLVIYLTAILMFAFFSLGVYWLFLDTAPIVYYGKNSFAEFDSGNVIFHLDALRMRDCPAVVRRKIDGCGQIDLPDSIVTTPIGERAGPVSLPIAILFQSFSQQQLSGNVCRMTSIVEGYCNPAQKLFKVPVITTSPVINFIPVPRSKSFQQSDKQ